MPRRMAGLALLASLLAACAARDPVPGWRAGVALELERQAEADPELRRSERWLLESGLAHAFPFSDEYDPALAHERLTALLTLHPGSAHRGLAAYLLPLLDQSQRQEEQTRQLQQEITVLREHIALLTNRIDELGQMLESAWAREEASQATIASLRAQLRQQTATIESLEETLQGLMQVDLGRREP